MRFYEKHADKRDRFVVLTVHDQAAKNFAELDEKMASLKQRFWGGKDLPFPILLDANNETIQAWGIRVFPTHVLIDPEGRLVKGGSLKMLEEKLAGAGSEKR